KGRLHFADPGDVIYSKIDVRNGAIGIVPDDMKRVALSSEYPVYSVLPNVALAEYIRLVFRTRYFRQAINSMISGASGRKRVQPKQIESLAIPLPPIHLQRAIVARWQQARQAIAEAEERIKLLEAKIDAQFFSDLGLKPPQAVKRPKAFAVPWKDSFQWSGRATYLLAQRHDLHKGKYPVVSGVDCLQEVKHGCGAPPSPKPTDLEILKISAVTRGSFDPQQKKYAQDKKRFREDFDLKRGDVLMCRTNGTLEYVGMSAWVDKDMDNLIFPDKVIRVRSRDNILPEYLWKILQLQPIRAQIEAAARTAVGNYAIGTHDIWNLQIPLPPLDVQRDLMRRVAEGRAEIARERAAAQQRARDIEAEIEALILGTRAI
ncbi:partial Type-1 restriction enzyme EcoKI specificity protein, partial [Anaerolineae bacterium]